MDDTSSLFAAGGAIAIYLIMFVVVIGIVALCYILTAYPLYQLAKNAGYDKPWLAWIPYANTYLMIVLPGGRFKLFNSDKTIVVGQRSTVFWIYLGCSLGGSVIAAIPVIGWLLSIVAVVAIYLINYQMYNDLFRVFYSTNSDTANTVLAICSMLIPFVGIVVLWIIRNNSPVYIMDDGTAKNTF